jgi:hypothetical protein
MPEPLAIIIVISSVCVALFSMLEFVCEGDKTALLLSLLCVMIGTTTLVWVIQAESVQGVKYEQTVKVENITTPQGNLIQAVQVDPLKKVSVTERFKAIYPEGTTATLRYHNDWSCGMWMCNDNDPKIIINTPKK